MNSGTDVSSFVYNGLGDRYQQIVNSATTTYQLDLAAGLVNVLADGENTYLYGNTVLAQVSNTQTGYYLPDVLGSVRQMTLPTGEVQLSQRFTPFGEVKEKYGDEEANFGYTAQKYDSQTGLLYLRARFYEPGIGRFIAKDTWRGDYEYPITLNQWIYVGNDPINNIDPSGHYTESTYCQNMPNKWMYELCIDFTYGIEPMNPLKLGDKVTGKPGCYQGPSQYRAPGYIEGTGVTSAIPIVVNWLFSFESVYNFATFEQAYFNNSWGPIPFLPGNGYSDFLVGLNITEYAAIVYGLKSPHPKTGQSEFIQNYSGLSIMRNIGIGAGTAGGLEIGLSGGIGFTSFQSMNDLLVRGTGIYINASVGVDPLPILDIGVGGINMMSMSEIKSYRDINTDQIDKNELFWDITLGKHNVWLTGIGINKINTVRKFSRAGNAILALYYAEVYEYLHAEK